MCNCSNTILISKIEVVGDIVELIPNRTVKLENLGDRCRYNLILGCGLKCTDSFPVVILTDEAKIPLLDKFGNDVYFNQIARNRYNYCLGYGNNNVLYPDGQFVVYQNLCLPSPTSALAPAFFDKKKKGDKEKEKEE